MACFGCSLRGSHPDPRRRRSLRSEPGGGYYNGGTFSSPRSDEQTLPGCVSLQTYRLAIGGTPGEVCPFNDFLNRPLNPWHVELHLLNRGSSDVTFPFGVIFPFFDTTVLQGQLRVNAGQSVYFDLHLNDSMNGKNPPSDVGPWLAIIVPYLFPLAGNPNLFTTFPMSYDMSVTEDLNRGSYVDVIPPGFIAGPPFALDGARFELVRIPEPASFALIGIGFFGLFAAMLKFGACAPRLGASANRPARAELPGAPFLLRGRG